MIALALPPQAVEELVELVAERVLERLRQEQDGGSPWAYGAKAAAKHLGWPVQRVYKHVRAGYRRTARQEAAV